MSWTAALGVIFDLLALFLFSFHFLYNFSTGPDYFFAINWALLGDPLF